MLVAELVYDEVVHVIRACHRCVTIVDEDEWGHGVEAARLVAELLDPGVYAMERVEDARCQDGYDIEVTAGLPRDVDAERLVVRVAGRVLEPGSDAKLRVCGKHWSTYTVDLGGRVVKVDIADLRWAGLVSLVGRVYEWRSVRLSRLGERLVRLMFEEYSVYPSIRLMLDASVRGESSIVLMTSGVHARLLKHVAAFAYGLAAEGYAVMLVTNDVERMRDAITGIRLDGLVEGLGVVLAARAKPRIYVDVVKPAASQAGWRKGR